jgi:uncharacterized protein
MKSTLAKTLNWEKEFDNLDINILVKSASKVIAPLGPIQTFAARSPWMGMEGITFENVARKLKNTCNVDIYPDVNHIRSAWERGEISQEFLERGVKKWLDLQPFEIPRNVAEQFCLGALMLNKPSLSQWLLTEVKKTAKNLIQIKLLTTHKPTTRTLSQRLDQISGKNYELDLNHHMIKWCKLFLDESQAVWSMPKRGKGFYHAWRELIQYDPAISRKIRKQLRNLSDEADVALTNALNMLEIPHEDIEDYLEAHLLALPGWAGMMLWKSQQTNGDYSILLDYLAVRLSIEVVLVKPCMPLPIPKSESIVFLEQLLSAWVQWGNMPIKAWQKLTATEQHARLRFAMEFDEIARKRLWLEAWEKTYESQLMNNITSKKQTELQNIKQTLAQFIFCIDVRSEPIRSKLEKAGPFETFGTAGFFGLPIETCMLDSNHKHNSLPVMLKPQVKVKETALPSFDLKKYFDRKQVQDSLHFSFKGLKHNLLSSFLLPEISGPWLSFQALASTLFPKSAGCIFRKWIEKWMGKPLTEFSLDRMSDSVTGLPIGFSEDEKVHYVKNALKMMGLTDHFSPLVVICGHSSQSTNNPYSAALNCGACGGASGEFNARLLATLCNLPNVRKALNTEGILIPEDTVFIAAEHITTLDELRFVYVPELSLAAQDAFGLVKSFLPKVRLEAISERVRKLPILSSQRKNPGAEVKRMSEDWSEVRPEWGLARNAAFIIGQRSLTEGCNLDGRVFLHNYNWKKDQNGEILSNIMNGPVTVAQWINLQYYASTVAPNYYGSGNKATQTVTAGIGVMQGNASDLLSGLPWQSVMQTDQKTYHDPLRLLVVIQAPKEYVKRMLDQTPTFRQKVKNGWIRLATISPNGNWESWSSF